MTPDEIPMADPTSDLSPPTNSRSTALTGPVGPASSRSRVRSMIRDSSVVQTAEKATRYLFDAMDVLGDTVAEGLGLRKRPGDGPPGPPPP